MELTREEKLTKLKNSEALLKQAEDEAKALRVELGLEPTTEAPAPTTDDETATLARRFVEMTPMERIALYRDHPEEHQRILEAVERDGMRKLLGGLR